MPENPFMKSCPELVNGAQRDRTAESLGALIAATRDDVFHFLGRHDGDAADAEDATQETFRQMSGSRPSLREPAAFPGWIHRIALRAAHETIRGRGARRKLAEDLSRNAPATEEAAMSDAERRETRGIVRSAVDALDADLRATVILRYEQGLSYAEIADAMECPEGTVGKRLHTAHERLQKSLAGAGVATAAMCGPTICFHFAIAWRSTTFWRTPRSSRELFTNPPSLLKPLLLKDEPLILALPCRISLHIRAPRRPRWARDNPGWLS